MKDSGDRKVMGLFFPQYPTQDHRQEIPYLTARWKCETDQQFLQRLCP